MKNFFRFIVVTASAVIVLALLDSAVNAGPSVWTNGFQPGAGADGGSGGITGGANPRLVYVAKEGIDDAAAYRGTEPFPYLTIQFAVNTRAPAPTTVAEYLTSILFIIAPGTYTEAVTVSIRQSVAFEFNAATVPLPLTWTVNNALRFGSGLNPVLSLTGGPQGDNTSVYPSLLGNNLAAINISNNAATPVTGARMIINNMFISGQILDVNANTTAGAGFFRYCQMFCTGACNASTQIAWIAVINSYNVTYTATAGISISGFIASSSDTFGGPITMSTAAGTARHGFIGARFSTTGTKVLTGVTTVNMDATSNYWFVLNAWTLAGGPTKVITENLDGLTTPINTTNNLTVLGNTVLGNAVGDTTVVTGNFTVDSPTFFVDATLNRVGVGTITPGADLNVLRNVASGDAPKIQISNSTVGTFGSSASIEFIGATGYIAMMNYEGDPNARFDHAFVIEPFKANGMAISLLDPGGAGDPDFRIVGNAGSPTLFTVKGSGEVIVGTATTSATTFLVGGTAAITGTLDQQGAISDSTGDLTISDNLVVTGTLDLQSAISDSTGDLTVNDNLVVTGAVTAAQYLTTTNCTDATASPAACGSAAAGAVIIDVGATSVTVETTAVGTNSEINIEEAPHAAGRLGVTCNVVYTRQYKVTTVTNATSFVITSIDIASGLAPLAPVTNPACLTYTITNF